MVDSPPWYGTCFLYSRVFFYALPYLLNFKDYFQLLGVYFGNSFQRIFITNYKNLTTGIAVGAASQWGSNERMMIYFKLMMVGCSLMMVKWVYDHKLISPSLTSISLSLTSILPSLAWCKPSLRSCTDCIVVTFRSYDITHSLLRYHVSMFYD